MIGYEQVLKDIESLTGKRLKSITGRADLVIDHVDFNKEVVAVHLANNADKRNKRSFSDFEKTWRALSRAALTDNPWVNVDTALDGSTSSRNQPETIMANLPYIVWARPNNRKCIAFVGRSVHELAEIKEADKQDLDALSTMREAEHVRSLGTKPRNWIFFGAPGTGKSYQLNKLAKDSFTQENVTRVTFYPDYTYSQFVGCFKPFTRYKDDADKPANKLEPYISYEFVPGPFLETYVKAVQNPNENYLLIVEEINRANPAATFGDVFQLLDRNDKGRSEYEVAAPREMRDYLAIFLPEYATSAHISNPDELLNEQQRLAMEARRLSLPPNMYIWATMNSADQGVFPMDTAFKRRWDFRYMGIDEGENVDVGGKILSEIEVPCGGHTVVWNKLRHAINEFMASEVLKINEDKLLGPFFIAPSALTPERFPDVFKDKVLLYLYEDISKIKRTKIFKKEMNTYAKICMAFDEIGEGIFGDGFDEHIVYGNTDDVDYVISEE